MPGKCSFHDSWLRKNDFKIWVRQSTVSTEAYCEICAKSFDISNMGRAALVSHAKSAKHCMGLIVASERNTQNSVSLYFKKSIVEQMPGPASGTVSSSKEISDEKLNIAFENGKFNY